MGEIQDYYHFIAKIYNSIQLKLLLHLFSVKWILRNDKTRPDTYAIFVGRNKFVIKGTSKYNNMCLVIIKNIYLVNHIKNCI